MRLQQQCKALCCTSTAMRSCCASRPHVCASAPAGCRGAVERVSRRWRRVALSTPAAALEFQLCPLELPGYQIMRDYGREDELPPERLSQLAAAVAACLRGRSSFQSIKFTGRDMGHSERDLVSPLTHQLWAAEVEPRLPAVRE